jgi:hypothetical protein
LVEAAHRAQKRKAACNPAPLARASGAFQKATSAIRRGGYRELDKSTSQSTGAAEMASKCKKADEQLVGFANFSQIG